MDFSILRRKWITTALLSIVLPTSLLATFRLTGVLREPQPPQIIAVETVDWNMSRPTDNSRYLSLSIDEKVENSYIDNVTLIVFGIHLREYEDNCPAYGDNLEFLMYLTSNISEGVTSSVTIEFSIVDVYAFLDIHEDPDWIELQNLETRKIRDSFETDRPYIDTYSIRQPKYTSLRIYARWMFLDKNTRGHRITATVSATRLIGTTYQTMTIPICLGVFID